VTSAKPAQKAIEQANAGGDPHLHKDRSTAVVLFTLPLAALLLYITLRGLDWAAFWTTIKTGHYEFLLLVLPIASGNYFIRALRWSVLVSSDRKVSVVSVFWANMVGYMGNAYLPARAGEVVRSAYLGQKSGMGTSFVLATALMERLLDVVALVLIGSSALLLQMDSSPVLTSSVRVLALAGFIGLVVIIAAPFQERFIFRILDRLPLPKRTSAIVSEQMGRFLLGTRSLQSGKRLSTFVLLTIVIWLVDAITITIGVRIIAQSLNLDQALLLLAALGLSSAIPSTPGYVGVYQFVAVTVLVPIGFSRADALAYILISQILNYIVVSFWGLLGLWQINRAKRSYRSNP
jgi:glycosyltransferase 2 family protein